jgi:hypothetical protein
MHGLLLLAIATAVFSLVNIAISTIPNTITIGDIGELCGNATAVAPTPTPTPTPTNVTNINFYDPFNVLNATFWISLSHSWIIDKGYVRTSVTDSSYNNAIYYVVDFIEPGHDTVRISTRVRTAGGVSPGATERYCVFLATTDLNIRILGCIELSVIGASSYVYARLRMFRYGSVQLLASATIERTFSATRDLSLTVKRINETHVSVAVAGTGVTGDFSLSPVIVEFNWSDLGYFGLHMTRRVPTEDLEGFDYIDVWITSQNATSTVYYNVNFPPPLPTVTVAVTTTVTERMGLGGDILVLPVGSIARFLGFVFYIAYIARVIKHFIPEF